VTITFRIAKQTDVDQIVELFLIRFPWMNNNWMGNNEAPKVRVHRNVSERLSDPCSITVVGDYCGELSLVLRGYIHKVDREKFIIDALCTNDTMAVDHRARIIRSGGGELSQLILNFAKNNGAKKLVFETKILHMPSVIIRLIKQMQLPLDCNDDIGTSYLLK
jgi:hypothetical protein